MKFDWPLLRLRLKLGFLTANVAYALERKDIADELRAELKKLLG